MRLPARLFVLISTLLASGASLGAQGFFDSPETAAGPERYRTPAWAELSWNPTPVADTLLAGSGVYDMALAVGSNFIGGEASPSPYTRAMALVIADRLSPGARPVRLANHQLKFRRAPAEVARWSERGALAAALWKTAWRVHGADVATGLTLLDLAAAFDPNPSDVDAMQRYRSASEGSMEGRWLAAVRLPDGIDAPDIGEEPSEASTVLAEARREAEGGAAQDETGATTPELFPIRYASVLVPAVGGGVVPLSAEVVTYDAATLRERKKMMTRQRGREARERGTEPQPYIAPALEMDFRVGSANFDVAEEVLADLAKARAAFVRRHAGARFPAGLGVEFEIEGGAMPATGGMLSAAAGVLLESMSQGVTLAAEAGAAGQLGFGSKLQVATEPLSDTLRSDGGKAWLAVPDTAGADAADMAALGDLATLMDVQLLACKDLDHALQLLRSQPDANRDQALELFAEIGLVARRTPAETLLRNPLVRARLEKVLELCPAHLSAAALLKASGPKAVTASLSGSTRRLKATEEQVRAWVSGVLNGGEAGTAAGDDETFAQALADLRSLRPRLHPQTRGYADGIADLLQDFRDTLGRGGSLSARRAEALKRSLDSLTVEIVSLGLAEPG